MTSILVHYDGSKSAEKALERAIKLIEQDLRVKKGKSEKPSAIPWGLLVIVEVVPHIEKVEYIGVDPEMSVTNARTRINEIVKKLRNRGINATGIVERGHIADKIVAIAAELNLDMIVIGHKEIDKIGRFTVGNVAEMVAKRADRPVIIVR
jgi:nucleotide-binding universal stress UspA family protein